STVADEQATTAAAAIDADPTSDTARTASAQLAEAYDARDAALRAVATLREQRATFQRGVANAIPGRTRDDAQAHGAPHTLKARIEQSDGFRAIVAQNIAAGEGAFAPIRMTGLTTPTELKAVLEGAPTFTTGVGPLIDSERLPTVYQDRRPIRLLDRVTIRPVSSPLLHHSRQLPRTNVAAAVAEGAAKPKADLGFENATTAVGTIAVLTDVSRQALNDVDYLQGEIEDLMRQDLVEKTEEYLVSGDGVGTRPRGIINTTGVQVYTPAAAEDRLATLQEALDRLEDVFVVSEDTVALNHRDVSKFALARDAAGGSANTGQFLYSNPITGTLPVLLGEPLIKSPLVTLGTYILGDFRAIKLAVLEGVSVLIAEQNADNVEKNMVTIRVEYRATFVIDRPGRLVRGTFVDA
ncbi:MAG: phage major capsid protein, partial [Solirubrobacteraceae bacterium]|nr:phage major capsid protein [Solirubrobacteraceae bacterium]